MVIRNGDLWATLTGEAIPRHIQNVNLQLKLGRDYRTLTMDITGGSAPFEMVQASVRNPFLRVFPPSCMSRRLGFCLLVS